MPLIIDCFCSELRGLFQLLELRSLFQGKLKKHRVYAGHCSHVTNTKWSARDEFVLTTGGGDTAVVVWRAFGPSSEEEDDFDAHVGAISSQQFAPPPVTPPDVPKEGWDLQKY